jgi:hypothetical protein
MLELRIEVQYKCLHCNLAASACVPYLSYSSVVYVSIARSPLCQSAVVQHCAGHVKVWSDSLGRDCVGLN